MRNMYLQAGEHTVVSRERKVVLVACLTEAAEATAREAERSPSNTVPVSNDTAACRVSASGYRQRTAI